MKHLDLFNRLLPFGLLLILLTVCTQASANDAAISWLSSQQQLNGGYSSPADTSTSFQATSETVETFQMYDLGGSAGVSNAIQFIAAESYHSTEYLSRKIVAMSQAGNNVDVLIDELLSMQGADGGFGELAGYQGTAVDTAAAIDALTSVTGAETAIQQAVNYLLGTQRGDGGWSDGLNESSIYVTSVVAIALSQLATEFPGISTPLNGAQSFLLSTRTTNSLWGNPVESAVAVLAMSHAATDYSAVNDSAMALEAEQLADGSWGHDVMATALTLQALKSYYARRNSLTGNGTVTGYIVKAGTGEPIRGATVAIMGGAARAETNADGYYMLPAVPGGRQTIQASKDGYVSASKVAIVTDGAVAEAGNLVLGLDVNSAVVRGRIVSSDNSQPIADASVSLSGSVSYHATTDESGIFEIQVTAPASLSLTIEKTGFYPLGGNIDAVPGQIVELRQSLVREGAHLDGGPGQISGVIVDGETGTPVQGARFVLDNGMIGVSDALGNFSIDDVSRGEYLAELTGSGYETRHYKVVFQAGGGGYHGEFQLYEEKQVPADDSLTVYGLVVDGVSGEPVPAATIDVSPIGGSYVSGIDGRFTLDSVLDKELFFSVSANGYKPSQFTLAVSAYGEAEVVFKLPVATTDPSATDVTLSGAITDKVSGLLIEGAVVQVINGGSATTSSSGVYRLAGISDTVFDVSVSAVGYKEQRLSVEVAQYGAFKLDASLNPEDAIAANDRFQITAITPVVQAAGANGLLLYDVNVANLKAEPQDALIMAEVFDAGGNSVGLTTPYADGTEIQQSEFVFGANEQKAVRIPWQTSQLSPGVYRMEMRVVEIGSISRVTPRGALLAVGDISGTITQTRKFDGALEFDPPLTQAGSNTPVTLNAVIVNSGNVPLNSQVFRLQVLDPKTQDILFTAEQTVDELAVSSHSSLSFGEWLPTAEGDLPVSVVAGEIGGRIISKLYVGDKASGLFSVNQTIVPEGTRQVHATISLSGVDAKTATSTDPLFFAVKEAVGKGGEYVAAQGVGWHKTNRCLGCHIQTQSFVGLAESMGKAQIDTNAAEFLLNAFATSQREDGGLRVHYNQYTKTLTAMGLWALSSWPDKSRVYMTELRAAQHMYQRRHISGDKVYWDNDGRNYGWWYSRESRNMMVTKGMVDLLQSWPAIDRGKLDEYRFGDNVKLGAQTVGVEAGRDGFLYVVGYNRLLFRVNMETGVGETVAALPMLAYGVAQGPDNELYVTGQNRVVRVGQDGSVTTILSNSDIYTDVAVDADGSVYVASYNANEIMKLPQGGEWETYVSGGLLQRPYGIELDDDGALLLANRYGYNILRVDVDRNVTVYAEGLAYRPLFLAKDGQGGIYVTTENTSTAPSAALYIDSQGQAMQVASRPILRGIAVYQGAPYLAAFNEGAVYSLVKSSPDPGQIEAQLAAYREAVAGSARYILASHQNGTSGTNDNIIQAVRMMTLGEASKVIDDSGLKTQVEWGIAYIDNLLRARQRADGGWGKYRTSVSDPLVTALVGLALDYTHPSAEDPVVRESIQYLLSTQQADNSWPNVNGILGTKLASTSMVMAYMPKALDRLGGIDVDLNVVFPSNVDIANLSVQPASEQSVDGGTAYRWELKGVTSNGRTVEFDLALHDMLLGETRAVATEAYLEFTNSFTEEKLEVGLDVPAVEARSELGLDVSTDRTVYGADEPVQIKSDIYNTAQTMAEGQILLSVRAVGAQTPLAELPPVATGSVDAGATTSLGSEWLTGHVLTGNYELYGRLLDSSGRVLDEDVAPFTIVAAGSVLGAGVHVEKALYDAWDFVQITGNVRNDSGNSLLQPTIADIRVHAPDGRVIATYQDTVEELVMGGRRNLTHWMTLADAAAGNYIVEMDVMDAFSHKLLATVSSSFSVERTWDQALLGTVRTEPSWVYRGDGAVCTETVQNRSTVGLEQIILIHELADAASGQVLASSDRSIALLANDEFRSVQSVATDTLDIGEYACVLKARFGEETVTLGAEVFGVLEPPIRIDAGLATGQHGRLLVLLDSGDQGSGGKARDPQGTPETSDLPTQRLFLESLLTGAGWSYTIVTDEAAFANEFHSGGYSLYLLQSEHVKLSEPLQKELREAVFRGEGLVVAGDHDQRNAGLDPALGIKSIGKSPAVSGFDTAGLITGEIGQYSFLAPRTAERTAPEGAEIAAQYFNGETALTRHAYGEGVSIYIGFDLLAEMSQDSGDVRLGELLLAALDAAHPESLDPTTGSVIPLQITLVNDGIATPGVVVLPLPPGVEVIDPAGAAYENDMLTWTYDLAEAQQLSYTTWLRLPASEGPLQLPAIVYSGAAPDLEHHADVMFILEVGPGERLSAATAQLQELMQGAPKEIPLKQAAHHLEQAQQAMADVDPQRAITALVRAADELLADGREGVIQLRLTLDRLLRRIAAGHSV